MHVCKKQWITALILLVLSVPIAVTAVFQGWILTAADAPAVLQEPVSMTEGTTAYTDSEPTEEPTAEAPVLLRAVSPQQNLSADGGMVLELSAEAVPNAKVSVALGKTVVSLAPSEDTADGTGFMLYKGSLTLPAGKPKKQKLGTLHFTAELDGQIGTLSGAFVTVNALQYADIPIDVGQGSVKPPEISGEGKVDVLSPETDFGRGTARMLCVTADYAETCPGNTANDQSSPLCTPFVRGTYDYITGEGTFDGKAYYITKSGYKVEQADSESFDGYVLPTNTASVYKSYTSGESHIILTMNWKVPFVSELKPQTYHKGYTDRVFNVVNSTAQYIDFTFYYTNAAEGSADFAGSNAVKSAEWRNIGENGTATLRVYLRQNGKFYGYRAYYSSDNRLVLSFRNKPKSVRNAVVAIDPGHGGRDCGAIAANGAYESALNLRVSALLKQKLEAQGVRVVIFRASDTYLSKDDRQRMARESGADVYISLHHNSSPAPSMSGTEVYYYRAYSKPLAASIHANLASAWQEIYKHNDAMRAHVIPQDGGVRYYPFGVTRVEECPAVLVECGYLSNTAECDACFDPVNQDKLAGAICRGIIHYLKNS